MNNIGKLIMSNNINQRLFAKTILQLMQSQGFYCKMFEIVNDMDEEYFERFCAELNEQNFDDMLDVVLYLEQ